MSGLSQKVVAPYACFSVRLSSFYKNSYGTNPCWIRKQIAEFGCLETWKGQFSAGCLSVCCSVFYKAIENIVMLHQKWIITPWCLETSKANRNHFMSLGLLLRLLQKMEQCLQMSFSRPLAPQTGISGILDGIRPCRGSSAFLALSLHYSSRISKWKSSLHMWRARKTDPDLLHGSLVFLPYPTF